MQLWKNKFEKKMKAIHVKDVNCFRESIPHYNERRSETNKIK